MDKNLRLRSPEPGIGRKSKRGKPPDSSEENSISSSSQLETSNNILFSQDSNFSQSSFTYGISSMHVTAVNEETNDSTAGYRNIRNHMTHDIIDKVVNPYVGDFTVGLASQVNPTFNNSLFCRFKN